MDISHHWVKSLTNVGGWGGFTSREPDLTRQLDFRAWNGRKERRGMRNNGSKKSYIPYNTIARTKYKISFI